MPKLLFFALGEAVLQATFPPHFPPQGARLVLKGPLELQAIHQLALLEQ